MREIHPEEERRKTLCPRFDLVFNWFKVLWRLEDDHIQKMNGNDYTLYLVFLRYAAWVCFVITVIDVVIFFPLYATGGGATSSTT